MNLRLVNGREQEYLDRLDKILADIGYLIPTYVFTTFGFDAMGDSTMERLQF